MTWHANPPRLEEPSLGVLVLDPDEGYTITALDLGDPLVRAVVNDAPGADGTIDTTKHTGARSVTMTVFVEGDGSATTRTKLNALRAYTRVGLRPFLYVTEDPGEPEERVQLRKANWMAPQGPADHRVVTIGWQTPTHGHIEAATEQTAIAFASGSGSELGIVFDPDEPFDPDIDFPATPIIGSTQVVNNGNTDVWPVIRIYGLCTEPNIENLTTGKKLEFNSLTINAGEFLEIDTRNKTVRYQGLASDNRYDKLDFAVSAPGLDLRIVPGENLFRFYPATNGATSQAEIVWRSAWL